jgi:PKD repeat protein
MFYMTWGRKNGDASNCAVWPPVCTYLGMDSLLRLRYIQMAEYDNGEISAVGAVWRYIRQNFPAIELYQADESHPSPAGSYAAACCFYSALFKKDPTLITFDFALPPADAASIRNAAKTIMFDSLVSWDLANHFATPEFSYIVGPGLNEAIFYNRSYRAQSYLWDFGDGDTSTLKEPSHNYAADGTYIITLTVYSCDFDHINQSIFTDTITFCAHNPVISPASLFVCPYSHDSLWTQTADNYQWFDDDGDSIQGETNQFLLPYGGYTYSVSTTLNGCTEMSPQMHVDGYSSNGGLVFYYVDSFGLPDTSCLGDSIMLVLNSNKPDQMPLVIQWYNDGIAMAGQNDDTLYATASGIYKVTVTYNVCPDQPKYESGTFTYAFVNCNFAIDENEKDAKIKYYPNPFESIVVLKVEKEIIGMTYFITDISGREVRKGVFERETNYLKLDEFRSGIYFLHYGNGLHSIKLIRTNSE